MVVDIGIVTYYDGVYGEIKKEEERYIFLAHDIMNTIRIGDYVSFRGEEVQRTKRAYFVNSLEKDNFPESTKDKQKELI